MLYKKNKFATKEELKNMKERFEQYGADITITKNIDDDRYSITAQMSRSEWGVSNIEEAHDVIQSAFSDDCYTYELK